MKRFAGDIKFMLNVSVGIYWKFCWVFFIPVSLTAILVYFIYNLLPDFIVNLGIVPKECCLDFC